MEDIYVSLELENNRKPLSNNEDLVTIKTKQGTLAKRVLVKGLVGSGKSTLMAKLAYTWAQRKSGSPLNQYKLVFILSFREIQRGCSLVDAIFQQILADDTKVSKTGLEAFIHSNTNNLFLVDGFDEYGAPNLDSIQGSFESMLNFKLLRSTSVIVTTRPHKHLGKCQSFYEPVQLTGFSEKNVTLYLNKFFQDDSELVDGLSRKLSESDMLKSLSHIPVMLMLMCLLWEDAQALPNTQSELYTAFTSFLWTKFCDRYNTPDDVSLNDFLCDLGKVALDGLMPKEDLSQEKLVFDEKDFHEVIERGCQVGLLTKERLRSKLTVSSAVTYLHKSFEEYCAAYYWAGLSDDKDQFNAVLCRIDSEDLIKSKLEILKFCCGLSRIAAETIIQQVIKIYLTEIKCDATISVGYPLYPMYLDILQVLILLFESNFPTTNADLTESIRSLLSAGERLAVKLKSDTQVVPMWHAFVKSALASPSLSQVKSIKFDEHSSDSLDLISDTLIHMPDVNKVVIGMAQKVVPSPDTVNRLVVCLGRLNNLSTLMLYGGYTAHITLDMSTILHHMSVSSAIQLQHLALFCITCDCDTLSQLLASQHHLHQNLRLQEIQLRNGSMASILDAIKPPLDKLDLQSTYVGNAIGHIKHIIPHLQYLGLKETGLVEDDIVTLSEMLPEAINLSALYLDENHVGKAVTQLACVIPQMEILWLSKSHLEEEDILKLSDMLPEATNLSYLNLSDNNVGKAAIRLAESLRACSKLTCLLLDSTGLTDEGVTALAGTFCCLSNLEYLWLDKNTEVGNNGLDAVFRHLHHLPSLTSFIIDATIDSQCSALVRDCLTAFGKEVPHEAGVIHVFVEADIISSICNAASKYL